MKGTKKQKKDSSTLNLFGNSNNCNIEPPADSSSSPASAKQSNIICFSAASERMKSTKNSSLEEKALKSILKRASKLKW